MGARYGYSLEVFLETSYYWHLEYYFVKGKSTIKQNSHPCHFPRETFNVVHTNFKLVFRISGLRSHVTNINFIWRVNVGSRELLWPTLLGLILSVVSIFFLLICERNENMFAFIAKKLNKAMGTWETFVSISLTSLQIKRNLKVDLERKKKS